LFHRIAANGSAARRIVFSPLIELPEKSGIDDRLALRSASAKADSPTSISEALHGNEITWKGEK
jgi:hypothetical protein